MNEDTRRIARMLALPAAVGLCGLLFSRFIRQGRFGDVLGVIFFRGEMVFWAALILAAALGSGLFLLKALRLRPDQPGARGLFGVGLGLGAVSMLTLVFGSIGLTQRPVFVILLLVLTAMGGKEIIGLVRDALNNKASTSSRTQRASGCAIRNCGEAALWGVLVLFLLMNLTRAFEPPQDYDSLEYHAAAPAAWHSAGRVFFIRDNVYANFPQNHEMLFFLGMRLTGSPDQGAIVGQMLGGAMGFFAALALARMTGGLAGRTAGLVAAAAFYTWPAVTLYSGMPYVELPLLFYGTLALWGVLWAWRRKRTAPRGPRWIVLAGIAAGLAMGVKYTAALLVAVPLAAWLVVLAVAARRGWKEGARRAAVFVGVAFLAFLPWMARNWVNTRNPVYPLLYKVFGSSNWDAQKDARWTQAHSPKDRSPANFAKQLNEVFFFGEHRAALLCLLFVPLILACGRRTRCPAWMLLAHAAAMYVLWFLFTQQNARFLDPAWPVLAAVSALGLGATLERRCAARRKPVSVDAPDRPRMRAHEVGGPRSVVAEMPRNAQRTRRSASLQTTLVGGLLLMLLLFAPERWHNYALFGRSFPLALGTVSADEFLSDPKVSGVSDLYAAMRFVNDPANVPDDARILFLGEARTFYCRRPHVAPTVFDTDPFGQISDTMAIPEIYDGLKKAGITHVLVNTGELWRLQESYRYRRNGRTWLGVLDGFDWPLFARLARERLRMVWPAQVDGLGYPFAAWPRSWDEMEKMRPPPGMMALYEVR